MATVNPEIQFFSFAENGVLFHPGYSRIWVLNSVAATVWCLLPECSNEKELVEQLAGRFSIKRKQAAEDAAQCLDYLRQQGLLEGGAPAREHEIINPLNIELEEVVFQKPSIWAYEAYLQVPGCNARFVSTSRKFGQQFIMLLQHMRLETVPVVIDAGIALVCESEYSAWSVFLDARRYVHGVADNAVLPYLFSLLFVCALKGLERYFLLHGAVLESEGKVLVLPGVAKSGKTTLTAILAASGWRFYSDELVVLDVGNGSVKPFPFPMSIKPGSVEVLENYYPGLVREYVWERSDGQWVRYLLPPTESLACFQDDTATPSVLVFPQYAPGSGTRLNELSKIEVLQRLAATGSSNRCLRAVDVAALIALAEKCLAYSLVFDDAEKAVRLIGEIKVYQITTNPQL